MKACKMTKIDGRLKLSDYVYLLFESRNESNIILANASPALG